MKYRIKEEIHLNGSSFYTVQQSRVGLFWSAVVDAEGVIISGFGLDKVKNALTEYKASELRRRLYTKGCEVVGTRIIKLD